MTKKVVSINYDDLQLWIDTLKTVRAYMAKPDDDTVDRIRQAVGDDDLVNSILSYTNEHNDSILESIGDLLVEFETANLPPADQQEVIVHVDHEPYIEDHKARLTWRIDYQIKQGHDHFTVVAYDIPLEVITSVAASSYGREWEFIIVEDYGLESIVSILIRKRP